jgi:uncharacterized damage-inducible protein DinB
VAELPRRAGAAATQDELDIAPPGDPPFRAVILERAPAIVALLDENDAAARRALAATSDAEFSKPWAFKIGGQTMWTKSKFDVYRRTVLNHLVHHRGQLTLYLRLNEVPVPGTDGPSADEHRSRA